MNIFIKSISIYCILLFSITSFARSNNYNMSLDEHSSTDFDNRILNCFETNATKIDISSCVKLIFTEILLQFRQKDISDWRTKTPTFKDSTTVNTTLFACNTNGDLELHSIEINLIDMNQHIMNRSVIHKFPNVQRCVQHLGSRDNIFKISNNKNLTVNCSCENKLYNNPEGNFGYFPKMSFYNKSFVEVLYFVIYAPIQGLNSVSDCKSVLSKIPACLK